MVHFTDGVLMVYVFSNYNILIIEYVLLCDIDTFNTFSHLTVIYSLFLL